MNERIDKSTAGQEELSLAPEHKESRMTEIPELRGENRKVFRLNNKEQQAVLMKKHRCMRMLMIS